MDKLSLVYKQTKELMEDRPFARCVCLKMLKPHQIYKCLYCEIAYCKSCAEQHFGKTVAQYKSDREKI